MNAKKIKIIKVNKSPCYNDSNPKESFFYIKDDNPKEIENGKAISENIRNINSNIISEPLETINPGLKPDLVTYLECLDIYENNQKCYQDNFGELVTLEKWFSSIPEPYSPGKDWTSRENNRKRYGISDYCNTAIRKRLLSKRKCLI